MQHSFKCENAWCSKNVCLTGRIVQEEFLTSGVKYESEGLWGSSCIFESIDHELPQKKYACPQKDNFEDFIRKNKIPKKTCCQRFFGPIKRINSKVDDFLLRKMLPEIEDPAKIPTTCCGGFAQFLSDNKYLVLLIMFVVGANLLKFIGTCTLIHTIGFPLLISVPIIT
ncbi:hypothetical protein AK88_00305 [Plasmodium fragile]|uniref:Uncharacterized protein n=1 Tax=Plasmodium fragile TaxID=5857 RepID=A0A0D9QUB9_PLAFR|nr:uncharacterized protein AK88_00305 [Plasmodium fragile]KJP90136.1 hypothetical protein AK88_00305 [Plasmodium fragile]